MEVSTQAATGLARAGIDRLFRVFFYLLAAKLLFFTFATGLGMESFLPAFGAVLILMSAALFISSLRRRFAYLVVLDVAFSLLFFVNSLYLKYFGDFASVYDLAQIGQLKNVSDSAAGLTGKEILFLVDLFILFLLFPRGKTAGHARHRMRTAGLLILVGILCNLNPLTYNIRPNLNFFRAVFYRYDFVTHMGIVNYQMLDLYDFAHVKLRKTVATYEDRRKAEDWMKRKVTTGKTPNLLTGTGRGMNLILIQVESLQGFVVGKTFNGVEITPNLNRLAEEGVFFTGIYDQTGDGNSSDSTLLVNASLYPARKGAAAFLYPDNTFDSLPRVLKRLGYETAVMEAYKKQFWNSLMFDRALGFQHQFYEDDYNMTEIVGLSLSDKEFLLQSSEKILKLHSPFYALLRTLSSHGPFIAVSGSMDHFPLGEMEGEIIGYYMRSMHYVDSAIGMFLKRLAEQGLLSDTIIVVYGDHRSRVPFGELKKIGITDRREMRKIPLIVSVPGADKGIESKKVGGLIDLGPTLFNILGMDTSCLFFLGRDLAAEDDGFVIFRDGSYVSAGKPFGGSVARDELTVSDLILELDMGHLGPSRELQTDVGEPVVTAYPCVHHKPGNRPEAAIKKAQPAVR